MRVPDKEYYDICVKEFKLLEELAECQYVIKVNDIYYNTMEEKVYILMEYAGQGYDVNKFIKEAKKEEESL